MKTKSLNTLLQLAISAFIITCAYVAFAEGSKESLLKYIGMLITSLFLIAYGNKFLIQLLVLFSKQLNRKENK
jgi:hypothetical protein